MFAYDWILTIVVALAVIVLWEFIYGIVAVKLTPGQQFKFYYDINITNGSGDIYSLMNDEKKVLSYDVLSFSSESLTTEVDVLTARLSIYEGDIIVTDCAEPSEDAEDKSVRLETLVDVHGGYSYEELLKDAKAYLLGLMKDGVADDISIATYNLDNLDEQKIEQVFRSRMKKDNRFRKEEQIQEGIKQEIERIKRLYLEVVKFDYLLALKNSAPELFYCYTRYEQSAENNEDYKTAYKKEQAERENHIYALKIAGLTNFKGEGSSKKDPSEYFKMKGKDDATDVAIMVFNFREHQPHLQYEVIGFINAIVEDCSTIYDGLFN